jgi:hypothetical protein
MRLNLLRIRLALHSYGANLKQYLLRIKLRRKFLNSKQNNTHQFFHVNAVQTLIGNNLRFMRIKFSV